MKANVIQFTGERQVILCEEPLRPLAAGEILVRTKRTLISTGTESIVFTRNFAPGTHFDQWVSYPFRPGYLHCGVIEAVGEGVTTWKAGDRVATRGNHASHVIISATEAWAVPDNVSDEAAAWMGIGRITQIGVRAAEHRLGDAVVVIGLGLLGQLVVQYAALCGAREIIAIDSCRARLDLLQLNIPVHRLACKVGDALSEVRKIIGGAGADVVYDVTGHHAVLSAALPLARDFGRLVLLGDTGQPNLQTLTPDVITRGVSIVGAHDGHPPSLPQRDNAWTGSRINELFLRYVSRGQIGVQHLTTHRFRPDQAAKAYEMLQTDRDSAMAVFFEWD